MGPRFLTDKKEGNKYRKGEVENKSCDVGL